MKLISNYNISKKETSFWRSILLSSKNIINNKYYYILYNINIIIIKLFSQTLSNREINLALFRIWRRPRGEGNESRDRRETSIRAATRCVLHATRRTSLVTRQKHGAMKAKSRGTMMTIYRGDWLIDWLIANRVERNKPGLILPSIDSTCCSRINNYRTAKLVGKNDFVSYTFRLQRPVLPSIRRLIQQVSRPYEFSFSRNRNIFRVKRSKEKEKERGRKKYRSQRCSASIGSRNYPKIRNGWAWRWRFSCGLIVCWKISWISTSSSSENRWKKIFFLFFENINVC